MTGIPGCWPVQGLGAHRMYGWTAAMRLTTRLQARALQPPYGPRCPVDAGKGSGGCWMPPACGEVPTERGEDRSPTPTAGGPRAGPPRRLTPRPRRACQWPLPSTPPRARTGGRGHRSRQVERDGQEKPKAARAGGDGRRRLWVLAGTALDGAGRGPCPDGPYRREPAARGRPLRPRRRGAAPERAFGRGWRPACRVKHRRFGGVEGCGGGGVERRAGRGRRALSSPIHRPDVGSRSGARCARGARAPTAGLGGSLALVAEDSLAVLSIGRRSAVSVRSVAAGS